MMSDEDLQMEVQAAIKLQQELHLADIDIRVADGTVTLTGTVNSFVLKTAAEKAAENVVGIKTVITKIDVMPDGFKVMTDNNLKAEILNVFKSHWDIPDDKIEVTVKDGLITLEGKIKWHYQKEAATEVISSLIGVKSVNNNITVERKVT